ncbi:MAG: IMP dehydrogenase [Planctomycetes bacterium]|nr:IMP dehydrogenase [Planctomycetota bacterium]
MQADGESAREIFGQGEGLTYNDFIVLPGHIDFAAEEVDLSTRFTRRIALKVPVVSSPMDTVTEHKMAISLALMGGIGIIHYNNTAEEQAAQVRKVKRFENGFITDPVVLSPRHRISDIDRINEKEGFSGIPITEDGTLKARLVGIVTNRDIDFEPDRSRLLQEVMVTELQTAPVGISLAEANQRLRETKKGKLPIVDAQGRLVSLVSRTDLKKNRDFPDACKDKRKQLRVGAAVSTREVDRERIAALVEAGVDAIVVDSAQGDSVFQIRAIEHLKKTYPGLDVLAGNVVTTRQCASLIEAGADGVRVGMGPGSICTTQDTMACGRAQATAVFECSRFCRERDVPVCADGGISSTGALAKALACGAATGMMGGLFAGTQEAPGEYFYKDGVRVKKYRGMASFEAMERGGGKRYLYADRGIRVAQGVSGYVVDKGSMLDLVAYIVQSLRQSLQDFGCRSLAQLHQVLESGSLRYERRSSSAQREGAVHSLFTHEEPVLGVRSEVP